MPKSIEISYDFRLLLKGFKIGFEAFAAGLDVVFLERLLDELDLLAGLVTELFGSWWSYVRFVQILALPYEPVFLSAIPGWRLLLPSTMLGFGESAGVGMIVNVEPLGCGKILLLVSRRERRRVELIGLSWMKTWRRVWVRYKNSTADTRCLGESTMKWIQAILLLNSGSQSIHLAWPQVLQTSLSISSQKKNMWFRSQIPAFEIQSGPHFKPHLHLRDYRALRLLNV